MHPQQLPGQRNVNIRKRYLRNYAQYIHHYQDSFSHTIADSAPSILNKSSILLHGQTLHLWGP